MPAKSGVGGGIVAVLPGQLGLAVFSPRLDAKGNSVRGLAVCEEISKSFDLHMFHSTRTMYSSTIRRTYNGNNIRSNVTRSSEQNEILRQYGSLIKILDLTGDLQFVSAELIMHEVMASDEIPEYIIMNFENVSSLNMAAIQQLSDLCKVIKNQNTEIIFIGISDNHEFNRKIKVLLRDPIIQPRLNYPDLDRALEYCEQCILSDHPVSSDRKNVKDLSIQSICAEFTQEELDYFSGKLEEMAFSKGRVICKKGEPADRMYFVIEGQVSAWYKSVRGYYKQRLNVICEGWSFGESALLRTGKRSADIIAENDVKLLCLETNKLLNDKTPVSLEIQRKIFKNLAEQTFIKLAQSDTAKKIFYQ
jgi:glutaminase